MEDQGTSEISKAEVASIVVMLLLAFVGAIVLISMTL
jgi:hypothetical protein